MTLLEMGAAAKKAARGLAVAGEKKTAALVQGAKALVQNQDKILAANGLDIAAAKENGMSDAMLDRLLLTEERIASMAQGMLLVADAKDPVGRVLEGDTLQSGISLTKVSVPLGVVGVIYESRPNVTADCAALCIKAGNAVILRGGKEAYQSNRAIAESLSSAFTVAGLPENAVQLVGDLSRQSAVEMMELTGYIDVLIPRGGAGLIQTVVRNSKVPVIETGVGNCHVFVDEWADVEMAAEIVFNAKCSRPSVCNAMETLLVHEKIAEKALPKIAARLSAKQVQLRGCEKTRAILPQCEAAGKEDWATEFLDYILAVRVVTDLEEALSHIGTYSSGHSEAIVTNSYASAERFIAGVDSAAVYVNASTRFTDGGEFGLGAEIGISTQKLHARGPMGLSHLVSYKYILRGSGQIR